MSTSTAPAVQPLGSFIHIGPDGVPSLHGFRCSSCGEVLLEHRRGCPNCAALGTLEPTKLSDRGTLFTYTIVHRSFPGIKTPFVSAIVKLDSGGFLKGNLERVVPAPAHLPFDMPVRVEFERLPAPTASEPDRLRHIFVPLRTTAVKGEGVSHE
jgi:uncharacterized OB-fold protein